MGLTPEDRYLQGRTRRQLFRDCGVGVGKIALASLLGASRAHGAGKPHFPPRIDHVIFLFMAGGPSQLELLDYKPELMKWDSKATPDSYLKGKRFAFMDTFSKETPKLLGSRREFKQYGKSGMWVSDLLPHVSGIVDDIALVHGCLQRTSIMARRSCSRIQARCVPDGRVWARGSRMA